MLDAESARITKTGTVTIGPGRCCKIVVEDFESDNATCREVSVLAMLWAIGELQRELMATLESPDGGDCAVN